MALEKWPRLVWIFIWLGAFTLISGVLGNWIAWQQWQHPRETIQAMTRSVQSDRKATGTPTEERAAISQKATVSVWPFVLTSASSVICLGLLAFVAWRITRVNAQLQPANPSSNSPSAQIGDATSTLREVQPERTGERDAAALRILEVEREHATELAERESQIKGLSDAAEVHAAQMRQWSHKRPILATKAAKLDEWQTLADKFWKLKNQARRIRRCWPDSPFERHPVARLVWEKQVYANTGWFRSAIAWHESFENLIEHVTEYHKALSLEELIGFLDNEERRRRGRLQASKPTPSPIVTITRYGSRAVTGGGTEFGFFITNFGSAPASDIVIHGLRFGSHRIYFPGTIATLAVQGDAFVPQRVTTNESGNAVRNVTLVKIISDWQTALDTFDLNLSIWLSYKDLVETRYTNMTELKMNPEQTELIPLQRLDEVRVDGF